MDFRSFNIQEGYRQTRERLSSTDDNAQVKSLLDLHRTYRDEGFILGDDANPDKIKTVGDLNRIVSDAEQHKRSYKSNQEIFRAVDDIRSSNPDYEKIYTNDKWDLYLIYTPKGASELGSVKWCTTSKSGAEHFVNYSHENNVQFCYMINRKDPSEKYAIAFSLAHWDIIDSGHLTVDKNNSKVPARKIGELFTGESDTGVKLLRSLVKSNAKPNASYIEKYYNAILSYESATEHADVTPKFFHEIVKSENATKIEKIALNISRKAMADNNTINKYDVRDIADAIMILDGVGKRYPINHLLGSMIYNKPKANELFRLGIIPAHIIHTYRPDFMNAISEPAKTDFLMSDPAVVASMIRRESIPLDNAGIAKIIKMHPKSEAVFDALVDLRMNTQERYDMIRDAVDKNWQGAAKNKYRAMMYDPDFEND